MAGTTEQTPVSQQPEQQSRPESGSGTTSSTNKKTPEQILLGIIEREGDMKDLKEAFKKSRFIKEPNDLRRVGKMRDELFLVMDEIVKPNNTIGIAPTARRIILTDIMKGDKIVNAKMTSSDINAETAPVVYEFLRIAMDRSGNYNFDTPEGMQAVLKAMLAVAPFEEYTSQRILEKLLIHARNIGCPEGQEDMEAADRFVNPKKIESSIDKLEREKYNKKISSILDPVDKQTLGLAAQQQIERHYEALFRDGIKNGTSTVEGRDRAIKDEIAKQTDDMRTEIRNALHSAINAISAGGEHDKMNRVNEYTNVVIRLQKEGKISAGEVNHLLSLPDDPELREIIQDQRTKIEGDSMIQEAMRVFVPTDEQISLMRAISSANALKHFLQTETKTGGALRYLNLDPNDPKNLNKADINWSAFTKSVQGLFEELLSVADRNPQQFFDQAFNPMYEGHMYQVFLQRLNQLGGQVAVSEDEFFKKEIAVTETDVNASEVSKTPPFRLVYGTKTVYLSLATAITQNLHNEMNEHKGDREYLHNVSNVCVQGLGWEQLKQYTERLDIEQVDKLMRKDPGLSLAYNLLTAAQQQEVKRNGGVTMTSLGLTGVTWKLNTAEMQAFFELRAMLLQQTEYQGLSEVALNRQVMQKIRMAAAISYGVTGEFWNIMLTARMPIESRAVKDYLGEDASEVGLNYMGTHLWGYEKMIWEVDPDLLLQRFDLPRYCNMLRYAHIDADLKNPKDPWSAVGRAGHEVNYAAQKLIEDSYINGRSNELIAMDENWVFLTDFLHTKSVGMFARAGWRFKNYDKCIAKVEGTSTIDYVQTLKNMRSMGSFLTKRFIDDQAKNITPEILAAMLGRDESGNQITLTAEELRLYMDPKDKEFVRRKEVLYKRLLFAQIERVSASKYLQLEEKRWTPHGEKLLRESLYDYLKGRCGDYPDAYRNLEIYNLYLGALTVAEKTVWAERGWDNPNYTFNELDIDHHEKQLREYFRQYVSNKGENDQTKIKIKESEEQFLSILKGFNKTLHEAINAERHHLENGTGPVETLAGRFSDMLVGWAKTNSSSTGGSSKGNIENLLAGDDFNLQGFSFSESGGRQTPRFVGETEKVTKDMNPALTEILSNVLPELVKGQYKDIEAFEKAIHEKLVPQIKKIHGAISGMDKGQADEYVIRLSLFIANMIGKDRFLRIKGAGSVIDWYRRTKYNTQASTYGDFFPNTLATPSHSLDSDEIYAMFHIIGQSINLPHSEHKIDHFEPVKFLGLKLSERPVYKKDHFAYSMKDLLKAGGMGVKTQLLETYLPAVGGIVVLMLLAMAYLANQKNKKK